MSQQLVLHNVVKVVQTRREFPQSDESSRFFKLQFLVTDIIGSVITISIFSDEELVVEEES